MRLPWLSLATLSLAAASLQAAPVFGPGVDPTAFRVTLFASGLSYPQSMQKLPDGSIAVQTSPDWVNGAILRFVDGNSDGIADAPGVPIYNTTGEGPLTQLA